jgi:putative flippase GtrA
VVLRIQPSRSNKLLTFDYWRSFVKFNIVGLSGVAVNEGVFLLLRNLGLFYLYASALAIEISITTNFFLNDLWTFRDRRSGHMAVRMVKFNALMIFGLIAQLAIVYAVTDYLGIDPAISNLVGIGGAFIIRYFLSIRYTWMRSEAPVERLPEVTRSFEEPTQRATRPPWDKHNHHSRFSPARSRRSWTDAAFSRSSNY